MQESLHALAHDLAPASVDAESPLISIIIPTYNRKALLIQSIESIITQTYTNWELIVVDDGSTDGTVESIHRMDHDRIQVVPLPHSANIAGLMNVGVEKSRGEWLAFSNSDDLWLPDKLESQMKRLLTDNTGWIYGGLEVIDENNYTIQGRNKPFIPLKGYIVKELLQTKITVGIISVMVQRKLFEEVGGFCTDPRLFCREDYEFILRLALRADASVVDHVVARVREHQGRTTRFISDAFDRSAYVYTVFLENDLGKPLKNLALRSRAFHYSEAAVGRINKKQYKAGFLLLIRSLWQGDRMGHWLSCFKKATYAIGKQNP